MADKRPCNFGSRVRTAREARGLSHRQIADATKLSVRVVDGIERGKRELIPDGIYGRAAVRAVATEVGLNPDETLRAFLSEHPDKLPMPGASQVAPTQAPSASRWLQHAMTIVGALVPIAAGF